MASAARSGKVKRAGAPKGASTPVLAARRLRAAGLGRWAAPRALPNALTLACLGLGFLSALAAGRGDIDGALKVMALAALADALAGLTARGLSLGTELGAELDSLASLMVWGVAVALLLYSQGLQALGGLGLALAGLVAVGAAWRLCRGDVQGGHDRYQGLPLGVGGMALVALAAAEAPPGLLAAGAVAVAAAWLSPFTWPRRRLRPSLAAPLLLGLMAAALGWRMGWIIPAAVAGLWAVVAPFRLRD